jgi:outer membrane protein OmpA-like peptidoglycan-associated protein/Mg-chelatase subunit ChlD
MFLFQSGKLYYSEKNYSGWSELREIDEEINSGEWQGDAMLSSDGNYLFFSAYREGEIFNINKMSDKVYHGDILYPTDLFLSKRDSEGNWSYPENLGDVINTRYCERFPFLHPDMKTLYFSSDGHGGLGKLDVFMTTRLSDSCWTCWSKPINLGKEINTIESDAGYKITTSGQEAYFALNNRKLQESSVLFILDVSGSMSGDKIEELKVVSKKTIEDVINNNAEVSITAFDGDCNAPITYYLPFTKDYNEVQLFIDNLYSSGGTPMYEAYYQASHLLKNTASKTSKNKILVLMTDGDATSCYNLNDVLYKLKSEKTLFRTQTIAYGVSENSTAYYDLNEISTYSGGDFYHAASTEDLGAAFEQANSNIYQIVSGPDNKDIYKINLPAHLRPDVVAKIEGELRNSKNKPVSTTIRWEDLETNSVIGTSKSDPIDGSYFIVLPMGKNYGYFVEDTSFFPISQNLDLRNVSNVVEIKKDIKAISFQEMIDEKIAVPMNNLFFNPMKSDLLPSSIPELKRMAKIIKDKNLSVELSGHTDNVGTESMNLKLSEDRANSVKNYLTLQGVSPSKIKSVGYGYSRPKASNETEEGKALNRRVEILFTN